ncbi:hypothetical protein EDC96DRAFT_548385 [Choanephora cucurbitarum]|nr:hypothetical protein EDC96DRAFT_548385 [Choanephora cucurbitarum]
MTINAFILVICDVFPFFESCFIPMSFMVQLEIQSETILLFVCLKLGSVMTLFLCIWALNCQGIFSKEKLLILFQLNIGPHQKLGLVVILETIKLYFEFLD